GRMSQIEGVCIAIGCRTPPRWRMVMAVCLKLRAYALQLDAEHLLDREWSWPYVSNGGGMGCNWVQDTFSVADGHGCKGQVGERRLCHRGREDVGSDEWHGVLSQRDDQCIV